MKHKRRYYQLFLPTHSIDRETDIKIERKKNEIKTAKMNEKKTQNSLFIFLTKRYKHKLPRIQRNSRLGSIKSREQKKNTWNIHCKRMKT